MRTFLIVLLISIVVYSSRAEADALPSSTVVRHKKKAGSGYLSSSPLYKEQQKKGQASIAFNIVLAFVLLGLVNCCGFLCWWAYREKSTEQPDQPELVRGSQIVNQEWAREFQSWKLLQVAGSRVGKQVAVLLFLFWEVCTWNAHHHLVLMNCRRDVLGGWVYACEGTKAFARCFPLFSASMAMIVTGRYILQFRIYYHFLLKNVLLDFTNHDMKKDLVLILVFCCFICALLHFSLDFFFPPYVTVDKITAIVTVYFLPCFVFFLLWTEASHVESRLMPLPKFVEDDPQWATDHISRSKKYLDTSIKHNCGLAERKLYYEKQDHRFTLDELLDEIIRISHPAHVNFQDEPDHGETKHGVHGLYKGLWPGRILLNPYLKDEESRKFKNAYTLFIAVFIVVQCVLLVALGVSAVQEATDALPGGIPHDAFYAGGEAFEQLGYSGYCRDEGQHRPPGYFTAIDKMPGYHAGTNVALMQTALGRARTVPTVFEVEKGTNLCAHHCAEDEYCIGFAMDPDLCNIYLTTDRPTPAGWYHLRAIHRHKVTADDESSHTKWAIVTTDHSMGVSCFVKLKQEAEPENFVGCTVYAVHIVMILWLIYMSALKTFKSHFLSLS